MDFEEYDSVILLRKTKGYPKGTPGCILEIYDRHLLIEVFTVPDVIVVTKKQVTKIS